MRSMDTFMIYLKISRAQKSERNIGNGVGGSQRRKRKYQCSEDRKKQS